MNSPRVAAQLYTIRDYVKTPADFAHSMKRVRALGYSGVQLDWEHHPDMPPAEIKRICDGEGLAICCSHFSFEQFAGELPMVIERQQLCACTDTAIVAMPHRYHAESEAGYQRFAADATAIGERLAQAGITLSYHNHSFEFVRFGPRTGLGILFAESDPRYLQAELDTYWVQHGGGDPAAWIASMRDRAPIVHYKDMVISQEGKQLFAEVGEGNLNWPAIITAGKGAGVEWYIVEQDNAYGKSPFDCIETSLKNLRQFGLT
jgi:sugar phosphate isomerase/epimerase